MNKMDAEITSCTVHKKYGAKRPPVATKKNPHGCAMCWRIFAHAQHERMVELEKRVSRLAHDVHVLENPLAYL